MNIYDFMSSVVTTLKAKRIEDTCKSQISLYIQATNDLIDIIILESFIDIILEINWCSFSKKYLKLIKSEI